jgi:hypothetical protein
MLVGDALPVILIHIVYTEYVVDLSLIPESLDKTSACVYLFLALLLCYCCRMLTAQLPKLCPILFNRAARARAHFLATHKLFRFSKSSLFNVATTYLDQTRLREEADPWEEGVMFALAEAVGMDLYEFVHVVAVAHGDLADAWWDIMCESERVLLTAMTADSVEIGSSPVTPLSSLDDSESCCSGMEPVGCEVDEPRHSRLPPLARVLPPLRVQCIAGTLLDKHIPRRTPTSSWIGDDEAGGAGEEDDDEEGGGGGGGDALGEQSALSSRDDRKPTRFEVLAKDDNVRVHPFRGLRAA